MVAYKGSANAPILVVGGTPNRDERQFERAFSGIIGDLFDDVVKEVGLKPSKVQYANAVQFGRNKDGVTFNGSSIRADARKHLLPYISQSRPKVIIVCGNTAGCALGLIDEPEKLNTAFPTNVVWHDELNAWLIKAPDPYFLHKSPEDDWDYRAAFRKARRYIEEGGHEQVPVEIIDILKPNDIDMLFDEVKIDPNIAYDYETSSNRPENLFVTTCSFSTARQNADGDYIAYFYPQYDMLQPLYEEHVMRQFREGFTEFFQQSKSLYDLIGYNSFGFDDKVTEAWLGQVFPGCTYDVMLMKWAYDTHRPHGLKETTELLLGYEDWDRELYEKIREISKRRTRVLREEEDFRVLRLHGYEPTEVETKKGVSYRWSDKADKKLGAYALMPLDEVRIYNALDSVYTKLNFNVLMEKLKQDPARADSCELRHRIGERIMRCEQRGVWTNLELNQEFSKTLSEIEDKTKKFLVNYVAESNPEIEDFNPNSPIQLVNVIFGQPTVVPFIDKFLFYKNYDRKSVDQMIDLIHLEFYDNFDEVVEAGDSFDYDICADMLAKHAKKKLRMNITKNWCVEKKVYLHGLVRPNEERGYTKSGNPSTATFLLNEYYQLTGSEFISMLLMYKKASKLKSTFVDGIAKMLDPNQILRGRFNLTGTRAGRLSSSNPNCQNYPKNVRGQHQPRPGYRFVEFDLSAAEVRTIAAMSGDTALLEACQAKDMHKYTASIMFNMPIDEVTDLLRQRSKTLLFGILYGMSAYRLSYALKITVEEAETLIEEFFRAYPVLKKWIDDQPDKCVADKYHATTLFGTKCSVKNLRADKMKERSHAQRVCSNAPIQGTAGELTLWYICEIMDEADRRGIEAHLFNTTHDSGSFEVPIAQCEEFEALIHEIVSSQLDLEPLHLVKFKADTRISDFWSDEPNIYKAIDPKYGKEGSTVPWDLINAEENLDKEELEELVELEEAYEQRRSQDLA